MNISGVYKIQSVIKSEYCYIGSAVNISKRWNVHLRSLYSNKHENKKLQNHYNKYGKSDLQFSILLGCPKEDLIKIEQYFLDSYNPYFNICKNAGNCLGRRFSDESKKKIGESNKGNQKRLGAILSEKTRQKISNSLKGKHPSEETRKKLSDSHKGNHVNLGRKHTEAEKQKSRENSLRNGNRPPNQLGKPKSEEHKMKISIANKGKVVSEETRRKLSESGKAYFSKKRLLK